MRRRCTPRRPTTRTCRTRCRRAPRRPTLACSGSAALQRALGAGGARREGRAERRVREPGGRSLARGARRRAGVRGRAVRRRGGAAARAAHRAARRGAGARRAANASRPTSASRCAASPRCCSASTPSSDATRDRARWRSSATRAPASPSDVVRLALVAPLLDAVASREGERATARGLRADGRRRRARRTAARRSAAFAMPADVAEVAARRRRRAGRESAHDTFTRLSRA